MTPIASQLKLRLDDRRSWFANEWFFKWHHIGGRQIVEIDLFDGRKARYGGIRFEGSPHDVYWDAIARGARKEVIEQFDWVESRIGRHDRSVVEAAIEECAQLLIDFIASLRHAAVEKDRILRGNGIEFPTRREAGVWPGTSEAEITQLAADLKKSLFPGLLVTPVSSAQVAIPERRLSVVFVADVVGYANHTARNELQTVTRLRTFETEILEPFLGKYHGRVFNKGGDSFLLEFSSSVRAIECWIAALSLLRERQVDIPSNERFQFRAGIHLGEVLVQDGNLLGETVNIASRLQTLARPGSLCASALVVDQVAKRMQDLAFRDIGLQSLKNIPQPVHAYLAFFSPDQTGNPVTEDESPPGDDQGRPMSSVARDSPLLQGSGRAAELLTALAHNCADGLGRKNYLLEDIQKLLPRASTAEIDDIVHQFEADGLVRLTNFFGGSWHLRLTPRFYAQIDISVLGWSTAEDAKKLAERMLATNIGRANMLHQASGWERRRFNPAFQYVLDRVPSSWVSRERSPEYSAVSVIMQPEVRAALRKLTAHQCE
jgi:class 3 adenylate cyclase